PSSGALPASGPYDRRSRHAPAGAAVSVAAPAIAVEGLRKAYGERVAVDGISFNVEPGEVLGILGPNGAGKTTTVEILEGLRSADAGTAHVAGIDVLHDPDAVKGVVGVQLQASSFFDNLSLAELLELFGAVFGAEVDAPA